MVFDLQLFGGKGGSSTTVQSAKPTAQELRLQDVQANYAEKTAPTALALQSMGSNMILNNPGVMPVDYTQLGNNAMAQSVDIQNQTSALGKNISGLSGINAANLAQGQSLYNGLTNTNNANQVAGTAAYNGLISNQNALDKSNAASMQPLMNGQLPSAYADNQAYAINRGLQTGMGNLLSNQAARGIINSSAMDTGIQGLSDSLANTLSANYNQNMQTAAAMQNQNATQQQTGQNYNLGVNNNLVALRQQGYDNQNGIASGINTLNQNNFANQSSIYDQQANNINQQNGLVSQGMTLANAAQNASIDIPGKILALSQGQQSDTSSLLNTLAGNRIADKTTTQTSSGTGLLGGLLNGVGSYYGAKG
jgi:hypothetical protein